jgi:membrane-associated phospholipid phosphatase
VKAWLYDWGGLNIALFHAINGNHAPWLDALMQALTWVGDHNRFEYYLAVLAIATWWQYCRERDSARTRTWLLALATFSLGYVLDGWLVIGLKSAFDFPRPPAVFSPGDLIVVGTPELHHSFPSGHASFAMLVAASLWPLAKRRASRVLLVAVVFGVCLSRPYLGFHFPADVLFGSLKSLLLVVAIRYMLRRFDREPLSHRPGIE